MKLKAFGLAVILCLLLSCSRGAKSGEAKIYQDGLQGMLGKDLKEIMTIIQDSWKFGLVDFWKSENPSIETVLKNNYRNVGFSKKEAKDIFASQGKYEVKVYLRELGKSWATTGEVTWVGTAGDKDKVHEAVRRAYIRVVFRDDQLVHFRVRLID